MKKQNGVGLVEVMVALTIGLFLLLGLVTIFSSLNQTFTLRQQLSTTQDNERMAMSILGTSIHNAGYYPIPQFLTSVTLLPVPALQFPASTPALGAPFAATQVLAGTTGAANSYTDTISIRFIAGLTSNQGCSSTLVAGTLYTDVFSVASSGGTSYLVCTEYNNATTPATAVTVNLIAGVTGISVLYGVDTTGSGSVTQYRSASSVTAASQWFSVKTVKITLRFSNPLQGQPGQLSSIYLTQTIPFMIGVT